MSMQGKWNLVIDTPFGSERVIAELTHSARGYAGTLTNDEGLVPLTSAQLTADEARFGGTVQTPFGELELAFYGVLLEGQMLGKCQTTFGTSNFAGNREVSPLTGRS